MNDAELWQTIIDRINEIDPDHSQVQVKQILDGGIDEAFRMADRGQTIARQVTLGLPRPE